MSEYWIDGVELHFDSAYTAQYERDIPASFHPSTFDTREGGSYRRQVIKYHIPFSGNKALFYYSPSYTPSHTAEVTIEDGCVCFEIINFRFDLDEIDRKADRILNKIRSVLPSITEKIDRYNASLDGHARNAFRPRKEYVLRRHDFASSLKVPLKKRDDVPETFSIPTPNLKRRVRISKPPAPKDAFKPEPTLEQSGYEEILQFMHDLGKQLERMPSTYKGKREEDLRDYFLLLLEPRFEGAATGETFNKKGKTDILVRYQGSNVFVAECKFWDGQKQFLESIDQLLGYLTWRDSKTALVTFVRNKDFSSVLTTVEEVLPNHPNYLRHVGKHEKTWFDCRFHLTGDRNREMKVAVMLFHVPK